MVEDFSIITSLDSSVKKMFPLKGMHQNEARRATDCPKRLQISWCLRLRVKDPPTLINYGPFYIPDLIHFPNDVEENPGITVSNIDHNKTVHVLKRKLDSHIQSGVVNNTETNNSVNAVKNLQHLNKLRLVSGVSMTSHLKHCIWSHCVWHKPCFWCFYHTSICIGWYGVWYTLFTTVFNDGFVKLKKYISVYCQQIYKKAVIYFDYPVAFLKVSFKCGR